MLSDAKNDFEHLKIYAWDGGLLWRVESETLDSRVWCDTNAVDYGNLNYHGSADSRKSHHVAAVAKARFP